MLACGRFSALVIAGLLMTSARSSAQPPALPSLRHLVYEYRLNATQLTEKDDSGEGRDSTGNGSFGPMAPNGRYVAGNRRTGTIAIDVVAATEDGGLVADVSEGSDGRAGTPVRCTIARSMAVVYDPKFEVADEARLALRYLSRGTMGAATLAPGATWRADQVDPGFAERVGYRLASIGPGSRAHITFDGTILVSGSRFLDSTEHGTITYDTLLLAPVAIDYAIRTLETVGTHRRSADEAIELKLISDSFASK